MKWSDAEIKILKERYPDAYKGAKELEQYLPGRNARSIKIKAHRLGIKRNGCARKYSYDLEFWSSYNSISCYWAGFVAADGSVYPHSQADSYVFSFGIKEKCQIEKFALDCSSDYPIEKRKPSNAKWSDMYYIRHTVDDKWLRDLKKNFNIGLQKTYAYQAPSQIPADLFPYFLLGFIDGDGSIGLQRTHDNKYGSFTIKISLATRSLLDHIRLWVESEYPSNTRPRSIRKCKDGYYHLVIGGATACQLYLKLRELLPSRHLSRKWDNQQYVNYCQNYISIHK